MSKILFVDDDRRVIAPYAAELEARGRDCLILTDVDDALREIELRTHSIALVVWDMMMPPGVAYAECDTHGGMLTGMFLFNDLRRLSPSTLAILFTNRSIWDLPAPFNLADDSLSCKRVEKTELLPDELADVIERMLL